MQTVTLTSFFFLTEIFSVFLAIGLNNKNYRIIAGCFLLFLNICYYLIGTKLISVNLDLIFCVLLLWVLVLYIFYIMDCKHSIKTIISFYSDKYIKSVGPKSYFKLSTINFNEYPVLFLKKGASDLRFPFYLGIFLIYLNFLQTMVLFNPLFFYCRNSILIPNIILSFTILILITIFIYLIKLYKPNPLVCLNYIIFALLIFCIITKYPYPYNLETSLPSIDDLFRGTSGGSGPNLNPFGPSHPSWPSGPSGPSGPSVGPVDRELALRAHTSDIGSSMPRLKEYYSKFGPDPNDNYIVNRESNLDIARTKLGFLQQNGFSDCPIYEKEFNVGKTQTKKLFLVLDVSGAEGVKRVYPGLHIFGIEIPNPADPNKTYFIRANTGYPNRSFLEGVDSAYDYRSNPSIQNSYLLKEFKSK